MTVNVGECSCFSGYLYTYKRQGSQRGGISGDTRYGKLSADKERTTEK